MVTVHVCSKLKTSWQSVVFTNKVGKNSRYFVGVFSKTIIPLAVVALDMRRLIIANSALRALLAIHHLMSNAHTLLSTAISAICLGWCCFEWHHGTIVGRLFKSSFTEYYEVVQDTGLKFVPWNEWMKWNEESWMRGQQTCLSYNIF